jgi:hypothetical protein
VAHLIEHQFAVPYPESHLRQLLLGSGCTQPRTTTQILQQQFRGCHSLIKSTVFWGLVARNLVLPRFYFELNRTKMFDEHFHWILLNA